MEQQPSSKDREFDAKQPRREIASLLLLCLRRFQPHRIPVRREKPVASQRGSVDGNLAGGFGPEKLNGPGRRVVRSGTEPMLDGQHDAVRADVAAIVRGVEGGVGDGVPPDGEAVRPLVHLATPTSTHPNQVIVGVYRHPRRRSSIAGSAQDFYAAGIHYRPPFAFGPGFTVPGRVFHDLLLHRAQDTGGSAPIARHSCPHRSHRQSHTETVRRSRFVPTEETLAHPVATW